MRPLILFLMWLVATSLHAQSGRPITAEDLWNMKRVAGLTVSPDGQYGVFVVTEYSIKDNKGNSDLWLVDLRTNKLKRLTTNVGSDNSPVWHPNSRTVAFVSKREGDYAQLYQIDIDGGEASLLADMPLGISNPKYFADGKKIAFVSQVLPEFENDMEGLKKAVKDKKDSKVTAKVTENRLFRYWDSWLTDGYTVRLYSYDLDTKTRVDLMPGNRRLVSVDGSADYDLSPDGQWVAMSMNSTAPPYFELNTDVFLWKIGEFEYSKNLTLPNIDEDYAPLFSEDGKTLYYGRTERKGYPDRTRLMKYDLATGKIESLTDKIDLSFGDFQELPKKKEMVMSSEWHARSGVYSLNLQSLKLDTLWHGGSVGAFHVTGDRMVFVKNDLSAPSELFEMNLKTRKTSRISSFNKTLLDSIEMGRVESVYFTGAGGRTVQMFVGYPPGFDPSKKYPLLHLIHGGPHGTFGDEFHYRWNAQLFAAPGYVTAMVNFHGSTSFGNEFTQSIVGAHGDKPFTDIMNATDYLIRNYSFIDSTKMAAAGGSYGGYMVNWIAGHTDRFKALISHAGVYNLMGQFGSDVTYERSYNYDGAPWDGRYENINKYSPAYFAHQFKTPMLIIHGERDYRVPITQGLEIYSVLKGKQVDARLVYYPNENHWILSPQNSIYWYKEVHDWLKRYLQ